MTVFEKECILLGYYEGDKEFISKDLDMYLLWLNHTHLDDPHFYERWLIVEDRDRIKKYKNGFIDMRTLIARSRRVYYGFARDYLCDSRRIFNLRQISTREKHRIAYRYISGLKMHMPSSSDEYITKTIRFLKE